MHSYIRKASMPQELLVRRQILFTVRFICRLDMGRAIILGGRGLPCSSSSSLVRCGHTECKVRVKQKRYCKKMQKGTVKLNRQVLYIPSYCTRSDSWMIGSYGYCGYPLEPYAVLLAARMPRQVSFFILLLARPYVVLTPNIQLIFIAILVTFQFPALHLMNQTAIFNHFS